MQQYGFSVTRILQYKDKIYDFVRFGPYTGEYGSLKTRDSCIFYAVKLLVSLDLTVHIPSRMFISKHSFL